MKITRSQIRRLITESVDQERTPTQKIAELIKADGDISQAEILASQVGIDIFEILASDNQAVTAVLGNLIDDSKGELSSLLYRAADNSLYEMGFFNALLYVLPLFPSFSFGMSAAEIKKLINSAILDNNDIYLDAAMGIGMTYSNVIGAPSGGSLHSIVKEWLIAIAFLKIEKMYTAPGNTSDLSDIIDSLRS